uniref:F2R like thrombin or trypsin receptor 3 n=1 Tax=Paramormyrops kingsleyae TaxID=1676925 RepID=A0A3B3S9T7_9TELE
MTRALQLLLALGWILEGQSTDELMNEDPLNGVEDSGPVMTGNELGCPLLYFFPREFLYIFEVCFCSLFSFILLIVVSVLYSVAFLVGLPANILALWVLIFHTEKIPSTILLINLTVLDVLVLLMLPFRITYHFAGNDWFFSESLCRLVMALIYGSMYGSMLCLAFISIDRYIALVHPYSALTLRSHRTSLAMSVSLWVVVLLTMMLQVFFQMAFSPPFSTNIALCYDAPLSFFFPFLGLLLFFPPLLVILFCHGTVLKTLLVRGHRYFHAACLTALVLLVFFACFLPNIIILLLYLTNGNCDLIVPYVVSLAFSCFGPCIDPFIYNYVSDDFRGKVLRVLCCRHAGQQVSSNNSVSFAQSSSLYGSYSSIKHTTQST